MPHGHWPATQTIWDALVGARCQRDHRVALLPDVRSLRRLLGLPHPLAPTFISHTLHDRRTDQGAMKWPLARRRAQAVDEGVNRRTREARGAFKILPAFLCCPHVEAASSQSECAPASRFVRRPE